MSETEIKVPEFQKVVKNGKIAVLYSPGFGAGWSSWAADEYRDFAIFDSGLVALAEKNAGEHEVKQYLAEKLGEEAYFYAGGWEDIKIAWLDEGSAFKIDDYDGSESVNEMGQIDWSVA